MPRDATDDDIRKQYRKLAVLIHPDKVHNYLVTKNSNSHNLRKSLNVVLNRPETELGRRSFVHRSAVAWNALPDNL